jgi:hypothetical protein
MSTPKTGRSTPAPLDIACTSTDCESGLHCFKATKKMLELNQKGACRKCGAQLVDWARVHMKNADDAIHTIRMLEYELIRHHFWHAEIDARAVNHARRKGRAGIRTATEKRIRKSVGVRSSFDGRQTPKAGNVIYYAQHATASCCRKCIEEWHDIPQEQPLKELEIKYLSDLCILYIENRLPHLTEAGEKVPAIRKAKSTSGVSRERNP